MLLSRCIFLLSLIVSMAFSWAGAQTETSKRTHLVSLKLDRKQIRDIASWKIRFVGGSESDSTLALVTPAEMGLLQERGYDFEEIMQSDDELTLIKRAIYGPSLQISGVYHTYDEIKAELKELQRRYPGRIRVLPIGRTSQEGRDILAVKISERVDREEDEPAILFSGAIHADELAGTEICMTLIHRLLEQADSDAAVQRWLDQSAIWFIPVINVDGHRIVTESIDPRWRKNTRDVNGNGVLDAGDGIDLNRNFDFNWAHGGSEDSLSGRYRGEFPFSEAECRAVRDLAIAQKFVLSVTYHSQGQVIYYPWDWRGHKAPDDAVLTRLAQGLAGSICTLKGDTTYKAEYGAGTVGQTYPWLYGRLGTLDFVVETGRGRHIFSDSDLQKIIDCNLPGAYYMLDQLLAGPGLTGQVLDAKTGKPIAADIVFPNLDNEQIDRRRADSRYGRFYRFLPPGSHRMLVSAPGYQPLVVKNAQVSESGWTGFDVRLQPVRKK
ncbi:MAG TPA: M14 family zinc carboxypeptidase [bacterium]|nr:M14 family zinc carboxypeptidase [bacterium]